MSKTYGRHNLKGLQSAIGFVLINHFTLIKQELQLDNVRVVVGRKKYCQYQNFVMTMMLIQRQLVLCANIYKIQNVIMY